MVDDFGCALFGPVLFVTLSFYGLQFLPLDRLYGDDYQVVCVASSALYLLCLLFVGSLCPLLPTRTGFQKSAYAATACSPCVDMSVSHTAAALPAALLADLLSVSGVCPDKDWLLSGKCTPSTAAGLLLRRHLCKSFHCLLTLTLYMSWSILLCTPSGIANMAFSRAAHSEHATAPCIQKKQCVFNICQN